jgi:hypothetical protein
MKTKHILTFAVAVFLSASGAFAQTPIAKWTFEGLTIAAGSTYTNYSTGRVFTNIPPEVGAGAASGYHFGTFGSPSWSTATGNGSSKSLTSAGWTNSPAAPNGDFYQFAVKTLGYQNIALSWDQIGSGTGPKDFQLLYSTDGITFTPFGSTYAASGSSWSSGTTITTSSFSDDLSSITAINNASVVYFRLMVVDNVSINNGTVGTAGTSRIDNFLVTGVIPGSPSIITQPASTNIYKGDTTTLSVTAGGSSPLGFQWYYTNSSGVVGLTDGPSGYGVGAYTNSVTKSSVTLTYVNPAQAGGYFVIVTNSIGSITSTVAKITVGVRTPIPTTIYAIRTNQTAAWFPVDTTNLYTVTGTVYTTFNMTAATSQEFYIEDATGEGISVFIGGGTILPNQGDSVTVTGPIGQFDGLLEFNMSAGNPTHILTDNGSGTLPAPKYFDMNQLANIAFVETNIEGSLVVVSNVFLAVPTSGNYGGGADVVMTNVNKVKLNLFVNAGATDFIGRSVPRFASSVTGAFGQFTTASPATNSYEVDVRQTGDVASGSPVTANPDSYSMVSNTTSLFAVLTNDTELSPLTEGALSLSGVGSSAGSASVDVTGTNITFTPDTDFTGPVTINYTATDVAGFSSSSVVTVTVTTGPTTIVPTVPPAITAFVFNTGNIVITGTNAQANGIYYLLETTNLTLPLSQWTPVATNVVGTSNGFTFTGTNVVTAGSISQYYLLSSTNNR